MANDPTVTLALATAPRTVAPPQAGEAKSQENIAAELFERGKTTLEKSDLPQDQLVSLVRDLGKVYSDQSLPRDIRYKCLATARLLMGKHSSFVWPDDLQTKLSAHPTLIKPGAFKKTWEAVKVYDFEHVAEGADNKVSNYPAISPEFASESNFQTPNIFASKESHGRVDGKVSASINISYTIVWTDAASGGGTAFKVGQKSSLLLNSDPRTIAYGSGPYTSGQNPDGLTILNGLEINAATSFSMGGLAVIKKDGQAELYPIKATRWGDLRTPEGAVKFQSYYRGEGASAFQSHLIAFNGKSMVDPNSPPPNGKSWERSMRRVLAVFKEGTNTRYAIIDFNDRLTLPEASLFLTKLPGLVSAINLDTGINNCSAAISPNGLGFQSHGCRKGGPMNPIILTTQ